LSAPIRSGFSTPPESPNAIFAAPEDSVAALGVRAAMDCLESAGMAAREIGLILAASGSSERLFPGSATAIGAGLGIAGVPAIDLPMASAGSREAEGFYRRLAVLPGSKLLDVACGSGQLALIAARNGGDATGIDIGENLIQRARERVRAEAESAFLWSRRRGPAVCRGGSRRGHKHCRRHVRAASGGGRQRTPVCMPPGRHHRQGKLDAPGFIGQMFRIISNFIAPPGMREPVLWGDEAEVRALFGSAVFTLAFARRNAVLNFPFLPSEVVRFFRLYHGPTNRAFASLNRAGRVGLQAQMEELWSTHNMAHGGFTKVEAEWLELVAKRA
jgi:hypothetical protein